MVATLAAAMAAATRAAMATRTAVLDLPARAMLRVLSLRGGHAGAGRRGRAGLLAVAKVRLGFFSFTEVTDPGEHRSYNEWHQLDHMPEQFPLPGVVFGQRWVSTPACRRARVYDDPALAPIHYMTLYLMGEPVDATLDQFLALGETLRSAGRFHEHRRARLSGPLSVTGMVAAPRVHVSPEAIPYRPNCGVYVVVREGTEPDERAAGATTASGDAHDEEARLAASLLGADGVAGVWSFATDSRFARHVWRPGAKTIAVAYLDVDPVAQAAALGDLVHAAVVGSPRGVLFAGPLETITPWHWDWFDDVA